MPYIATQSVGDFKAGDEVTGFSKERIETFLAEGVIVEDKTTPKTTRRTTKEDNKQGE